MSEKNLITLFKKPVTWYYVVMVLFGLLYLTIALTNHYLFRSVTEDYGTYNFAFCDYSHLRISKMPTFLIYGVSETFMQDHFSFTLFYLIPFYWLLKWLTGTYTLLIIQVGFILLSGAAIYKLVELKTSDSWLGVLAILYYFLLHGHYSTFSGDFNGAVIGACTIPIFLFYFETNRIILATTILIASLFSREDMPLCYFFICIVLIIWHRKDRRKIFLSLYYLIGCIVFFIMVFEVFIPLTHSEGVNYKFFTFSALGRTPLLAITSIIQHPIHALSLLFINQTGLQIYDNVKLEFYLVYLVSGGYLLLYRPYYLIWFIPMLAQKMFEDNPIRWSIELYYSITITTLLPITVFVIIPEIYRTKLWQYIVSASICILAALVTFYVESPSYTHAMPWVGTTKENIFSGDFFQPDCDVKKVYEALALIPPDAKVSASSRILPHLAQRKSIYEFPDIEDAQYIAAFTFHDFYATPESEYFSTLNKYIFSPEWDVIAPSYPFLLLKKQPNHLKTTDFVLCDAGKMTVDSLCGYLEDSNLNLLANESKVLLFAKEHTQSKHEEDFLCDAEKLAPDGKKLNNTKWPANRYRWNTYG